MDRIYEQLLAGVPAYETFLTAAEMDASSRALAEKYPDVVEVFSIGKSREGHDLLCLKIGGDQPRNGLMFGLPHPNEPIGTMMLEYLTENLAASRELREKLGYNWYIVKAWDYDGYLLNEGWIKGPYTVTNYSRNFFRPVSKQQVDWTFPIDYKELHFHDVMPEAEAMMKLIDRVRPSFIYSLHNAGFGGVYWYFTRDIDKGLYESLYEAPRRQEIPIHFGEPESPAMKVFYPAVFEGGGISEEYDYLEQFGVEDIAKVIDCGTCSDEYAWNLCKTITFLTEMPYFYDRRIDDLSPSDILRKDAVKQKIEAEKQMNQRVREIVAVSRDEMNPANPFLMAVEAFMKEQGDEATLKMVEENPDYAKLATQAEKFDNLSVSRFYKLLTIGMTARANEWELNRTDAADPNAAARREKLEKGLSLALKLHAEQAALLEKELDYQVIPIQKLVRIQLECGLKVAEYLRDHPEAGRA